MLSKGYGDHQVDGQSSSLTSKAPDTSDRFVLPSALPSFLEACVLLASRAAAAGGYAQARELMDKAARVVSLEGDTSQRSPPPAWTPEGTWER